MLSYKEKAKQFLIYLLDYLFTCLPPKAVIVEWKLTTLVVISLKADQQLFGLRSFVCVL